MMRNIKELEVLSLFFIFHNMAFYAIFLYYAPRLRLFKTLVFELVSKGKTPLCGGGGEKGRILNLWLSIKGGD